MYAYRLAYRHANGEIEGFHGVGFTRITARRAAERKVAAKLADAGLGVPDPARLVLSAAGLSAADLATVRADWAVSGIRIFVWESALSPCPVRRTCRVG